MINVKLEDVMSLEQLVGLYGREAIAEVCELLTIHPENKNWAMGVGNKVGRVFAAMDILEQRVLLAIMVLRKEKNVKKILYQYSSGEFGCAWVINPESTSVQLDPTYAYGIGADFNLEDWLPSKKEQQHKNKSATLATLRLLRRGSDDFFWWSWVLECESKLILIEDCIVYTDAKIAKEVAEQWAENHNIKITMIVEEH
jgi:hypothetical protein